MRSRFVGRLSVEAWLALVLRRQVAATTERSRARLFAALAFTGLEMYVSKAVVDCEKGGTRTNSRRAPKSSRRFWTGVPVRHQRQWARTAQTSSNTFVSRFLILWAGIVMVNIYLYKRAKNKNKKNKKKYRQPSSKMIRCHSWVYRGPCLFRSDRSVSYVVSTTSRDCNSLPDLGRFEP